MGLTPHKLGLHKLLRLLSPAVRPLLNAASERRLANAVNIADLRTCAKARMHPMCFGYLDSGSDDEVTLRRNHDAYAEFELHYHVLSGLSPETLVWCAALSDWTALRAVEELGAPDGGTSPPPLPSLPSPSGDARQPALWHFEDAVRGVRGTASHSAMEAMLQRVAP